MRKAAARARRWIVGLGMTLAIATVAPVPTGVVTARGQEARSSDTAHLIFEDNPAFRIPFNVDPETRKRIAEVHLYVSSDRGLTWDYAGNTAPDQPAFPFRAPRDGEYWFAVRTRDDRGRLYPPDVEQVKPGLKVVVDTARPSLNVVTLPRRGGIVGVRWEAQDEYLDLSTLVVEYQIQGAPAGAWRQVRVQRRLLGEARWDVGTGLPVSVRVSVEDKAGNRGVVEQVISDGLAAAPPVQNVGQSGASAPAPIEAVPYRNDPGGGRTAPVPGVGEDPFAGLGPSPSPSPAGSNPQGAAMSRPGPDPGTASAPRSAPPGLEPDETSASPSSPPSPEPGGGGGPPPLLVGSPRFPLQYAVEDASPEAVEVVEMWASNDGGASWQFLGSDPDRQSPFLVDLVGEGRYGLRIVVQSRGGLGDPRPSPGTPPQVEVVVDTTPPRVAVDPPRLGTGQSAGKLLISWRAEDPHLADRPIVLSIRPAQDGAIWQQITPPMENTGQYAWPIPTNAPDRFFVRVDASDALGNRSWADTSDPVQIDLARPRGRILGLAPNARVRSASPMR